MNPRRRWLMGAAGAAAMAGWPSARAELDEEVIEAGGCRITLQVSEPFTAELRADIRRWVAFAADTVAAYLGRFPVAAFDLDLRAVGGAGVKGGTTYAEPEPFVRVRLGSTSSAAQLHDDWVLVHEMFHLAVPRVPRPQNWLHEGIATYAEGVARVRAGRNTPARLWAELVDGLPQGQPQAGDRGLDHTPTWGRTYWGGAMFCLLGDVALLRGSNGQHGLRQGLRAVLAAGGHYGVAWPVRRILQVADAAGPPVLVPLYERMKDSADTVDLAGLWRELGVSVEAPGREARFDPGAPLAAVRRAIA